MYWVTHFSVPFLSARSLFLVCGNDSIGESPEQMCGRFRIPKLQPKQEAAHGHWVLGEGVMWLCLSIIFWMMSSKRCDIFPLVLYYNAELDKMSRCFKFRQAHIKIFSFLLLSSTFSVMVCKGQSPKDKGFFSFFNFFTTLVRYSPLVFQASPPCALAIRVYMQRSPVLETSSPCLSPL